MDRNEQRIRFEILEETAKRVIAELQNQSPLRGYKIVVIGGMAVLKHLGLSARLTEDVDFLLVGPKESRALDESQTIKQQLLNLAESPFEKRADVFYYQDADLPLVQVDFVPAEEVPFVPDSAMNISSIPAGEIPYIGVTDLLAFKVFSGGMRPRDYNRTRDVMDIGHLIEAARHDGRIALNHRQKKAIVDGLPSLVGRAKASASWLCEQLGCHRSGSGETFYFEECLE